MQIFPDQQEWSPAGGGAHKIAKRLQHARLQCFRAKKLDPFRHRALQWMIKNSRQIRINVGEAMTEFGFYASLQHAPPPPAEPPS